MTEPETRSSHDSAWLFLVIGTLAAGSGWLLDWMCQGEQRVPGIWLAFERIAGEHGFRDWMTLFGLFIVGCGAISHATHAGGRWLRRVPSLAVVGLAVTLGVHAWNASRWLLLIGTVLVVFLCLFDPQKEGLPRARARERAS